VPSSPATHRFLAIRIQCNTLLECVLAIIAMQTHAGDGRHAKHNVSENRLQQPSMSAMQCTPKRSSLCNVHFCRPTISRNQHPSSSHAANTNTTTCMETNICSCKCIVYIYIYIYIYLRHTTINCIPLLTVISESLQVHAASEKVHYLSTNLRLTHLRLTHLALEDCG
jgi:hypothetical protein